MWETKILGVDLYHVLAWFWLYSFCGWIWESSYVSNPAEKTGQPRFCQWSAADTVRHRRCYGILDPAPV